ncbi:MAG TPA: ATP-binding protein [Ohtaekwangia sp.]
MPELRFRNRVIYFTVILIGVLLLVNMTLVYKGNQVINHNKAIQEEAEKIRLTTVEMMRAIHLLDVGLRGYALYPKGNMITPFDTANNRKVRLMRILEKELSGQQFPMEKFTAFRDSVETYFAAANRMKRHLDDDNEIEFQKLFRSDRGANLVVTYRTFLFAVNEFQDKVIQEAKTNHDNTQRFIHWLQLFIFLLCVPTLFYLAHYSVRTFLLIKRLHESEAERVRILANQNVTLEQQVHLRTMELQAMNEEITAQNEEITAQNEEITAQNEEITAQNEQLTHHREELEKNHEDLKLKHEELQVAQKVIEVQHSLIQRHNEALVHEVDNQTEYLTRANIELKERNTRLEQFTYVISHNLRGPLSRIQGLAAILDMAASYQEMRDIADKMSISTKDLDRVVKDLTAITEIRNIDYKALDDVKLPLVLSHVVQMLDAEIKESKAHIVAKFEVEVIRSLPSYIESIFYNLISNAVKYRSPDRMLEIMVHSFINVEKIVIEFRDNGLGIDLQKHHDNLFLPYKRFHHHVQGRGLGLYLIKTQIETLDGKLEVESTEGAGSLFRILFRKGSLKDFNVPGS